jgi:hypothetical protein
MDIIVFYSWQSDHPNSTNRGFIGDALERAAKAASDEEVKFIIDSDTKRVAFSPDIPNTILDKIDIAYTIVSDVTIIDNQANKPSPNPNVLIELGYAMKTHGRNRYLLVMNTHFGEVDMLPFDLDKRRTMTYMLEPGTDKKEARSELVGKLASNFKLIAEEVKKQVQADAIQEADSSPPRLTHAIEGNQPGQDVLARDWFSKLLDRYIELVPQLENGDYYYDDVSALDSSIRETAPLLREYLSVIKLVSDHDATDAAHSLYTGFSKLLSLYNPPSGHSGYFNLKPTDYYKYTGYELFVMLIAMLLRNERWETIGSILERKLLKRNTPSGQPDLLEYFHISVPVQFLRFIAQQEEKPARQVHAEFIRNRLETLLNGSSISYLDFIDADLFLAIRADITAGESDPSFRWRPWSLFVVQNHVPDYLIRCYSREFLFQFQLSLGFDNSIFFKEGLERLLVRMREAYSGFFPSLNIFDYWDPNRVGQE